MGVLTTGRGATSIQPGSSRSTDMIATAPNPAMPLRRFCDARAAIFGALDARFAEMASAIPGITEAMLSTRLAELQEAGLVSCEVLPGPPIAWVYRLTDEGRSPCSDGARRVGRRPLASIQFDNQVDSQTGRQRRTAADNKGAKVFRINPRWTSAYVHRRSWVDLGIRSGVEIRCSRLSLSRNMTRELRRGRPADRGGGSSARQLAVDSKLQELELARWGDPPKSSLSIRQTYPFCWLGSLRFRIGRTFAAPRSPAV
jgi:hypothetical protein